KEYASAVFLKWFTAPEQNIRFISETGYLPVTKVAFEDNIHSYIDRVENPNIKKLLNAALATYNNYDFYIPPVFDNFDSLEKSFNTKIRQIAVETRQEYLLLPEAEISNDTYKEIYIRALETLTDDFQE
ncbi:MAG: ABC transporter substrate-binding protein, partial [Clostridiaceae bacterium]|nr:ABC transporter substrate-binding protein [Clostridiaceae bacterium]